MDLMETLAALAIGAAAPIVTAWILAKVKPEKIVEWVVKWLEKVVKDEKARNKVTNEIGKKLVEIGKTFIEYYPD